MKSIAAALDIGCRVVLIDTWDKSVWLIIRSLADRRITIFRRSRRSRSGKFAVVLAGSLSDANLLSGCGVATESDCRPRRRVRRRTQQLGFAKSSFGFAAASGFRLRCNSIGTKRAAVIRLIADRRRQKNFLDKGRPNFDTRGLGLHVDVRRGDSGRRSAFNSGGIVAARLGRRAAWGTPDLRRQILGVRRGGGSNRYVGIDTNSG